MKMGEKRPVAFILLLTKWGFGHHEATLRMNIRPDEVYSIMKHDVHPIFRYVPERKTQLAGRGVRPTMETKVALIGRLKKLKPLESTDPGGFKRF
jgi:hypothetical protein